jgi:hypothetical protein
METQFTIYFGLIAEDVRTKEILHFVGFMQNPNERDFAAIEEELRTDPEFGIMTEPWELRRASTREVNRYREIMHTSSPTTFENFQA